MNSKYENKINTFEDLIRVKQNLKFEISEQEMEIKNNKWIKLPSSFIAGSPIKKAVKDYASSLNIKEVLSDHLGDILSTLLMANKNTRKYFIIFSLAKEMIPFTVQKIKEIVNSK